MVEVVPRDAHGASLDVGDGVGLAVGLAVGVGDVVGAAVAVGLAEGLAVGRGFGPWLFGLSLWAKATGKRLQTTPVTRSVTTTTKSTTTRLFTITPTVRRMKFAETDEILPISVRNREP
jgi:hypothetical protein